MRNLLISRKHIVFYALYVALFLAAIQTACGGKSEADMRRESIMRTTIEPYKSGNPEIAWITYKSNEAFVGFSKLPSEWKMVIQSMALDASEKLDGLCHVWAMPATNDPNDPMAGKYYGFVSVRNGKPNWTLP